MPYRFKPSIFVFIIFIFFSANSFSAPNILNYQGTLSDDSGNPVNATKNMTFKIYDVPAAGTALWSSNEMQVQVVNGYFNVALEGFGDDLFSEDVRYLAVEIDGAELTERKRLASVPYAFQAGSANFADSAAIANSTVSGDIPPGAIIMWSGNNIPGGWALCNGQNGTPDLRDRFIVGAGNGYSVGSKGGVTTHNLSHSHTVNSHNHHIDFNIHKDLCIDDCTDGADDGSKDVGSDSHGHRILGDTWHASPGTDAKLPSNVDNRPPYYALCFIMKLP